MQLPRQLHSYFVPEGWSRLFLDHLINFLLHSVPKRFALCSLWSMVLQFVLKEELLEDISKRHGQAGVWMASVWAHFSAFVSWSRAQYNRSVWWVVDLCAADSSWQQGGKEHFQTATPKNVYSLWCFIGGFFHFRDTVSREGLWIQSYFYCRH